MASDGCARTGEKTNGVVASCAVDIENEPALPHCRSDVSIYLISTMLCCPPPSVRIDDVTTMVADVTFAARSCRPRSFRVLVCVCVLTAHGFCIASAIIGRTSRLAGGLPQYATNTQKTTRPDINSCIYLSVGNSTC